MTEKCIECKADIDESARICRHCQSYQNVWKNSLRFLAVLAGLLAIVGSASAYLWGEFSDWNRQRSWEDKVELIEFIRSGESSFLNSGDGELYLSYIHISAPDIGWEEIKPLNISIQPGQFAEVPWTSLDKIEKHRYRVGVDIPGPAFRRYLHATALWDECVFFDVYYEKGSVFEQLRKIYGNALNTFRVTGTLEYRSSFHGTKQSHSLDLEGVLNLSRHRDCAGPLNELRSHK